MSQMTVMLVYCEDRSHTANPVGPIITDPNPAAVLGDDVYVAGWFVPLVAAEPHWYGIQAYSRQTDPTALPEVLIDGQEREQLLDGTVLPPKGRKTFSQIQQQLRLDEAAITGGGEGTREKWSPRCRRCGQRGGRWRREDRDEVFSQLSERGITGVSLRTLDLIKHSGIRSI